MELNFASHCSYQIRYHQVLCVKYRKQMFLKKEYVLSLKKILYEISERYWYDIEEMGTDGDHVHIFVWWRPSISPSEIMQKIKSITAKELFKKHPEIKEELRWWAFWSSGWYIWTIWEWTTEEIVRKYIKNQWNEREKKLYEQFKLFKTV